MEYLAYFLHIFIFFLTRFYSDCIAMSSSMANQINSISGIKPLIMHNFIDQKKFSGYTMKKEK